MDDSNDSLLHRLVDSPQADFKTAMQRMGLNSVFDITRMDKAQFALELAKHCDADAGQAYDNAWSYAAQISRLYQEHQISSSDTRQRIRRSSQPDSTSAPTGYQALFEEKWDQFCNEGDIAAIDSPVAYLRALYLFAGQLESLASPTERITLEQRRPDLKKLMLDQQSAFATQPMLAIVNATLQSNIAMHLAKTDGNRTVQQVLASEHYPFSLPYDLHHHQCLLGLGAGKPALGELNYRISLKLPFSQDGATYGDVSQSRLEAQRLLSGLSPEQQTLLIAPIASTSSLEALHKSYGTQAITRLAEIDFFKERTGLTSKQIEQLLAAGEYAPRSSVNSPAPTREYYGASYINMRETNHALSKNGSFDQPEHLDRFDHLSPGRLDRMQRMIRLHRWTDIPFAELDTLIVNALRSEGNYTLNAKTLRALGIHRYLNRRHGITSEEFASFLHDMPIAACGNRVPLFDQVFNRTRLLENPVWQNPKKQLLATDQQTLSYLSAGLGLPITQDSLLLLIHQAEKYLPALQHDLPTASSLYRQARIARMLGLSPLECTELARLLGGDDFCKALVTGKLSTSGASQPDILDVLMAMDWAVDWLRQNNRDVLQWCRLFDETTNDLPLNENLEQQLAKLQAHASLSHDPQRLLETLLHDLMDLAAECVPSLLHMAGSDAAAVVAAINASPGVMPPLLATLLRIAEACRQLHLSSSTLATLMENPAWLASHTSKSLQPQTLYLLERFSHCARHQAQSEENLLHYLQVANQDGPHLEKEANRLLANLLNWSPEEVSSLTALLAPKRATTMEAVDWVMRCQACCVSTGLSADLLLKATALKTQSPASDWKIVGEALIAACH